MVKILKEVKILDIVKTNNLGNLTVFISIKSHFLSSPHPSPTPLHFIEKGTWYSAFHGSWCLVSRSAPFDRSMYLVSVTPSYSFMLCFCHGLKMCMRFEYDPLINVYHFLCILSLIIFQAQILATKVYIGNGYLEYATPSVLRWGFFKLCRCFCHGLKTIMWFGYNPQVNFYHFFTFWT